MSDIAERVEAYMRTDPLVEEGDTLDVHFYRPGIVRVQYRKPLHGDPEVDLQSFYLLIDEANRYVGGMISVHPGHRLERRGFGMADLIRRTLGEIGWTEAYVRNPPEWLKDIGFEIGADHDGTGVFLVKKRLSPFP